MKLNRRDFLKALGIGTAGAAAGVKAEITVEVPAEYPSVEFTEVGEITDYPVEHAENIKPMPAGGIRHITRVRSIGIQSQDIRIQCPASGTFAMRKGGDPLICVEFLGDEEAREWMISDMDDLEVHEYRIATDYSEYIFNAVLVGSSVSGCGYGVTHGCEFRQVGEAREILK